VTELEFSRPLRVAGVPAGGQRLRLDATPAECTALARRLGVPAVHALSATLALRPDRAEGIAVDGVLEARVTQECVVTLEPVEQSVSEAVALRILPEGQSPSEDPDAEDEVEVEGGIAELGEVMAQQLALALDPYPRAPGAVLPDAAQDAPESPFAKLSALKRG
jgi:uncharacterized metal-binding protein YceD (DUF177 family)